MATGGSRDTSEERARNRRLLSLPESDRPTPPPITEEARNRALQRLRSESPQPPYVRNPTPPAESSRRLPSSAITSPEPSPRPRWEQASLPGTMSSQGERAGDSLRQQALSKAPEEPSKKQREKTRKREETPEQEPEEKLESSKKGGRLKKTLKGIFKKDPVDESSLEHIKDHHWLEDSD